MDQVEAVTAPREPGVVRASLSPSRAGDFQTCPLLYRFRVVDRLPEPPDPVLVRGTLVHAVLEDLFDEEAPARTLERALELLPEEWQKLRESDERLAELFTAEQAADEAAWLASCTELLGNYFSLEDPRWVEPAAREERVEHALENGVTLGGIVDRLDIAPDGRIRVVDYKGLAVDTPLPTPTGWTTMGEVQVGDLLFGRDGFTTRVTRKSGLHHRPCYRVTFLDGTSVVCDNVHLWSIVRSHRQRQERLTVDADALFRVMREVQSAGTPQSVWVEAAEAIETADMDLPIAPWLLGAWLGDGEIRSGSLTVGKTDLADMLALVKGNWRRAVRVNEAPTAYRVTPTRLQECCSYGHVEHRGPTPRHPTRRCAHEHTHAGMAAWNLTLTSELRNAGLLGRRRIPSAYLRAGYGQRVALLRGLMDTDGWWNKTRRRAGFTTTDDGLAADVVELLHTLGITPQHFSKPYRNPVRQDRNWHIIEFTPVEFNPFSLPRKAILADHAVSPLRKKLARRRIIASVEPVESVPTQCIAVDAPDSLFLCGEGFVPTHNTGRAPNERFEDKALFQMRFYALAIWRTRGVIPTVLQLMYLADGETLSYSPDEAELLATERKLKALWDAIRRAYETGEFVPRKSALCAYCSHQERCPEWGGTPPPMPVIRLESVRPSPG